MITAAMGRRKMDKYIDREKLLAGIYSNNPKDVMLYIANFPAVNAAEAFRCEHCSKSTEHPSGRWCKLLQTVVQNSDYCSWGTKK